MSRFAAPILMLAAWLACVIAAPLAAAAQKPQIVDVAVGWDRIVPPERWGPVIVKVDGGKDGFGGAVVLEYNQDSSQGTRIIVPAAATPGQVAPIELTACFPARMDQFTVSLVGDRGDTIARRVYKRAFPGADEFPFDFIVSSRKTVVAIVGDVSVGMGLLSDKQENEAFPAASMSDEEDADPSAGARVPAKTHGTSSEIRWSRARGVKLAEMPRTWMSYNGVAVMVVQASEADRADPRVLDAIREWVWMGGHVCIVANRDGVSWRRWLPAGPAADMVELDGARRLAVPSSFASALNVRPRTTPDGLAPSAPATDVTAREIHLTASGIESGWVLRWSDDPASGGFLAEGPVGFGWATIVGVDPAHVAAVPSPDDAAAAWFDAIGSSLPATSSTHEYNDRAISTAGGIAVRDALDSFVRGVQPGPLAVIVVLGCTLPLVVLLGPVDGFVLRHFKIRQYAWLFALGWIGLASAVAFIAPPLVRTGDGFVKRVRVVDVLPSRQAVPDALPRAAASSVTGAFGDSRSEVKLDVTMPGWWRGVGASEDGSDQRRFFAPLDLMQRSFELRPGVRPASCLPMSNLWLGTWTLRAVADESWAETPIAVATSFDGGEYRVTLTGVAPEARVQRAWLRSAGSAAELSLASDAPGVWAGVVRKEAMREGLDQVRLPQWHALPGAADRARALEARSNAPSVGAVYLEIQNEQFDQGQQRPRARGQVTLYRIPVEIRPVNGGSAS